MAAHCFEAKPPHPACRFVYLRPSSRLTRAHDLPALRAPPSRHGRHRASSCSCSLPQPLGLPITSPRPHRRSKYRALPRTSLLLTRMLAAADTAAAHRRAPFPALLQPIPCHQIGSGRASGRPPTFPRPRAAADSPESGHPRRRPDLGLNCESPNLPRGFHAKQGPTYKKTENSRGLSAKPHLQYYM
jgi:hypothetical protein